MVGFGKGILSKKYNGYKIYFKGNRVINEVIELWYLLFKLSNLDYNTKLYAVQNMLVTN